MSRRTVASDRRPSHKSTSWARRITRFKNRFPRLLRTDYWRSTSNRTLWNSLFLRSRKAKPAASSRKRKMHRTSSELRHEQLETRALLSVNFGGTPYNQNFNYNDANGFGVGVNYPGDGVQVPAGNLPAGWETFETTGNTSTTIDNGSNGTADTYLYGDLTGGPGGNTADRALGALSNTGTQYFGASFVNTTGQTLTSFKISYVGEQWRQGAGSALDNDPFSYVIGNAGANTLTVGAYSTVTALQLNAPNAGSPGALNGNSAANQNDHSAGTTVNGISWGPGQVLYIRWIDQVGNTAGLAVDNFTISSNTPPDLSSINATPNIAENTTLVTPLTYTDANGDTVTFSTGTLSGPDAARFQVTGAAGPSGSQSLQFITAPDFENPQGHGVDGNHYLVTVSGNDGNGGITTRNLTVNVTNVNDVPVISSSNALSLPENLQTIGVLTATDQDVPAQTITFSVPGGGSGANQNLFQIAPDGHTLQFKTDAFGPLGNNTNPAFPSAPNYENGVGFASAAGGVNNVYQVQVQADDGHGGVTFQTINVTILNANDPPFVSTNTVLTVNEGAPATSLKTFLAATDDDGDPVTFRVTQVPLHNNAALKRGGVTLAVGDTFTQTDINNNLVTYTNDGSQNVADNFHFTVTDGVATSPDTTFNITITVLNDAPKVNQKQITVSEQTTNGINSADTFTTFSGISGNGGNLNVTDEETTNPANITITVLTLPTKGQLIFNGSPISAAPFSFTQADVNNGKLQYQHFSTQEGGAGGADSFNFTATDDGSNPGGTPTSPLSISPTPQTVAITVAAVNDKPTAVVNAPVGGFTFTEGSSVTLDATGSNDIDGTIQQYQWDFNADGSPDFITTSAVAVVPWGNLAPFFSSSGGTLNNVKLRVYDNASGGVGGNTNTNATAFISLLSDPVTTSITELPLAPASPPATLIITDNSLPDSGGTGNTQLQPALSQNLVLDFSDPNNPVYRVNLLKQTGTPTGTTATAGNAGNTLAVAIAGPSHSLKGVTSLQFNGGNSNGPNSAVFTNGDRLTIISPSTVGSAVFNATTATSGNIALPVSAGILSGLAVTYTGLSPIDATQMVASDLTFNLTTSDDTATIAAAGTAPANATDPFSVTAGRFQLVSTSSTTTFEGIGFQSPTNSLTVNGGSGNDTFIVSTPLSVPGAITLDGQASTTGDTITVNSPITTTNAISTLTLNAETINLNENLSASLTGAVTGVISGNAGTVNVGTTFTTNAQLVDALAISASGATINVLPAVVGTSPGSPKIFNTVQNGVTDGVINLGSSGKTLNFQSPTPTSQGYVTITSLAGNAGTTVALNNNTLNTGSSTNTGFGGFLTGTNISVLNKVGTGVFALGADNTSFFGSTFISGGTLAIQSGNALGLGGTATVTVGSGATFDLDAAGFWNSLTNNTGSQNVSYSGSLVLLDSLGSTPALQTTLRGRSGATTNPSDIGTIIIPSNTPNANLGVTFDTIGGNFTLGQGANSLVGGATVPAVNTAINTVSGGGTLTLAAISSQNNKWKIIGGSTLSSFADANFGNVTGAPDYFQLGDATSDGKLQFTNAGSIGLQTIRGITIATGRTGTIIVTQPLGTVVYGGQITGGAGTQFTKDGPGTLQLSGASGNFSWQGNTNIAGGTLQLAAPNVIPHAATTAGSTGVVNISSGATLDLNGSSGTVTINGLSGTGGNIINNTGTAVNLQFGDGNTTGNTFTGNITATDPTKLRIEKIGTGTQTLASSGSNFTGVTSGGGATPSATVTAGVLVVTGGGTTTALGAAAGNVTIAATGILVIDNTTVPNNITGFSNGSTLLGNNAGVMTGALSIPNSAGTFNLGTVPATNTFGITSGGTASTLTFSGAANRIAQSGNGQNGIEVINVTGPGKVVLATANAIPARSTDGVRWRVDGGTPATATTMLSVSANGNFGATPGNTTADYFQLLNGGKIQFTGSTTLDTARGIEVGSAVTPATPTLGGVDLNTLGGVVTVTYGGRIQSNSTASNDTGTFMVSGSTGSAFNLSAGNLIDDNMDVEVDSGILGLGGQETVDNLVSTQTTGTIRNATALPIIFTVGNNADGGSYAGAIKDGTVAGATLSLIKNGTDKQILAGASTYTGSTNINAGVLQVDGSVTSEVVVNSSGTLGGSGTVLDPNTGNSVSATTVNAGGTLAPGGGVGKLSFNGNVLMTSGSVYSEEIGGNTVGNPFGGTQPYDQVVINPQVSAVGNISLGGALLSLTAVGGYTPAIGDSYVIVNQTNAAAVVSGNFTYNDPVNGLLTLSNGSTFNFGGKQFKIFYTGGDGNDIVIFQTTPGVVYVSNNNFGLGSPPAPGQVISDASSVLTGPQTAIYGFNAFSTANPTVFGGPSDLNPIQTASNAVGGPNATVFVDKGTYNVVQIALSQGVTLAGPFSAAVDLFNGGAGTGVPGGSAGRGTNEAIIDGQSTTGLALGSGMINSTSIVSGTLTIDGFTLQHAGSDTGLNSSTVNVSSGGSASFVVQNDVFAGSSGGSIQHLGVTATGSSAATTGLTVTRNQFTGFDSDDIKLNSLNSAVSITSNIINNGVASSNAAILDNVTSTVTRNHTIANNTITMTSGGTGDGIDFNNSGVFTGTVSISTNTIGLSGALTAISVANNNATTVNAVLNDNFLTGNSTAGSFGIKVAGSVTASIGDTAGSGNSGNQIRLFDRGIATQTLGGGNPSVTITGNIGSIFQNNIGIDVTAGTATIKGNHIYNNSTGIRFTTGGGGIVGDNSGGGTVPADGNNFNDAPTDVGQDNLTDIRIDSTAGAVTIAGNNAFAGNGYYIDNRSPQSFNIANIGNTFDVPSNFGIEDRMFHGPDSTLSGVIYWKPNQLFVTTPGTGLSDEDIQQAISVAHATGDTVNIQAGSYTLDVSTASKSIALSLGDSTVPGDVEPVTINGNLTLDSNDTLLVDADGTGATPTGNDLLTINNGTANLGNATLGVTVQAGYTPAAPTTLTIVSHSGGVGTIFGTFTYPVAISGLRAQYLNSGLATATVNLVANRPPVGNNDNNTLGATEAGGVNNGTPGSNASGNVLTGAGNTVSWVFGGAWDATDVVNVTIGGNTVTLGPVGSTSIPTILDNLVLALNASALPGINAVTWSHVSNVLQGTPKLSGALVAATVTSSEQFGGTATAQSVDGITAATLTTTGSTGSNGADTDLDISSPLGVVTPPDTLSVTGIRTTGLGTVGTVGTPLAGDIVGTEGVPRGTLILNANGNYTYVVNQTNPAVQALRLSSQTLTDSFTYTVADAASPAGTATAVLTITIHGANDAPTAADDVSGGPGWVSDAVEAGGFNNTTAGSLGQGNVLANDTDVDSAANGETLSVVAVRLGAVEGAGSTGIVGGTTFGNFGLLTLNANGTYSYAVDNTNPVVSALRLFSQTLTDSFNYTVSDAFGQTDIAVLTVTIHGANDNPVAVPDTFGLLSPGGTVVGNVLANDTDADSAANGETKTVVQVNGSPANVGGTIATFHGFVTLNANGSFSYTHDGGASITDSFTYTVSDAAGATDTTTVTINITSASIDMIDTSDSQIQVPPNPLGAATNPPSTNVDNYTNINTPTFANKPGFPVPPGALVRLFDGTTLIGQGTSDPVTGNWSVTVPGSSALSNGIHHIFAAIGPVGSSTNSGTLNVTVDTFIAAGSPVMDPNTDHGVPGDNITNDNTPTFIFETGEKGSFVEVFVDNIQVPGQFVNLPTGSVSPLSATSFTLDGTATDLTDVGSTITGNSQFSFTPQFAVSDGQHFVKVLVTDRAGNTNFSPTLPFTIDSISPAAPAITSFSPDTGVVGDGVTSANKLQFTGTISAADIGSTIQLFANGGATPIATVVATGTTFTTPLSTTLSDGLNIINAFAMDLAGNVSGPSANFAVTVNSGLPHAPVITGVIPDSGVVGDGVTNANKPQFTGTIAAADVGSTIQVFADGGATPIATVVASSTTWTTPALATALTDGTHTITATATSTSSITGPASAPFTLKIDTQAPAPPAITSFSPDSGTVGDGITNANKPQFSGTIAAGDVGSTIQIFADGGATPISTVIASGTTWTTPALATALADGAHTITAKTVDVAGNASGASTNFALTIDTSAPGAPTLASFTPDSGTVGDGITNANKPQFTGSVAAADVGATIQIFADGGTTPIASVVTTGTSWTTPALATALTDGAHSITAKAVDPAGNASGASNSLSITIDTTAGGTPLVTGITAATDSGALGDGITSNNKPAFTGTVAAADVGSTIQVFADGGATPIATVVASTTTWTTPALAAALTDGTHSITAKTVDAAGNASAASATFTLKIDTTAPVTVITGISPDTGNPTDGVTTASTNITVSGTATAEAGSPVQLFDNNVAVGAPVTVTAAGTWSVLLPTVTSGTHPLTAKTTDLAANVGALSAVFNLVVDNTAPVAPVITGFSPDTGVVGDHITSATAISVTGTATGEGGSSVQLFEGATPVGSPGIVAAGGTWSVSLTGVTVGTHNYTAVTTDGAGNVGPASASFAITVDTTPPAAPTALALGPGQDSGSSATDNITKINTPIFTGTIAAADVGATVQIFVDGSATPATSIVTSGTTWTTPALSTPLTDGPHVITAKAVDAANNASAASTSLTITIDTFVATPATAPILSQASDSFGTATGPGGTVNYGTNSDNYSNVTTPAYSGLVATEANGPVKIQLFSDGVATGAAVTANAAGLWTAVTSALADGGVNGTLHQITIQVTDVAGNVSSFSPQQPYTLDTTAPVAGTAPDLDAASDTGSSSTDNFTDVTTPSLTGTGAEPNALVELRDTFNSATSTVATTFADASGVWHMTVANALATGTHSFAARVTDKAGNQSTSSALSVTIANTLRVTSFAPNPSGFDVTFNKPVNLADLNLYDGNDTAVDTPDVVLHDNTTNADVRGSLVWNAANNTLSFVKTGGILANDSYTVTLKSSATAFHDTSGNLLDGNGDLIDTQVNDNYTNTFSVSNAVGTRVVSVHDFARGPGQHVDDTPATANSRLAVSIDNAANVRSVDFTFNYDPTQLHVSGASLAASLPSDWNITFNNASAGTLIVSASGVTPLSGTNLPVVLIDSDVPSSAPYRASEALRMTSVALSVQSGSLVVAAPVVGDLAVHKTVYLGDVDGNGVYTGTDSALISRVAVGLDTGFDAEDYTDPMIVADVDGGGTVNGGDATIVAQRSVGASTPQIPTLPGITITQAAGGVDPELSVASNIIINGPALDILVNIKIPVSEVVLGSTFNLTYDTNALQFVSAKQGTFWSAGGGWNIAYNETAPGSVLVTLYNLNPSPAASSPLPIADLRFLTKLTGSLGTHAVGVQEVIPNDGGVTWTHVDGSVKVVAQPAYLVGDTDGDFDVDLQDLLNVKNNLGGTGLGDTDGDNNVSLQDLLNVKNNLGATLAHGSGGGSEALDAPLTASSSASSSPSSSAPLFAESALAPTGAIGNALPATPNLAANGLFVGPVIVVNPAASMAARVAQPVSDSGLSAPTAISSHSSASTVDTRSTLAASNAAFGMLGSADNDSHVADNVRFGGASQDTQSPSADSTPISDHFFEQLQSDEVADAVQQRVDGAADASQSDSTTDDYFESLSDADAELLQVK